MRLLISLCPLAFFVYVLTLMACSKTATEQSVPFTPILQKGKPAHVLVKGSKWTSKEGYMECAGDGDNFDNMLYSSFYIQDKDFHLKARLSLEKIEETTALFWFFNNHFGFDASSESPSAKKNLFIYTPKYDSLLFLGPAIDHIKPGSPFSFEVIRKDSMIRFFIDNQIITTQPIELFSYPLKGVIGFRPWRNTMRIYDWSISGSIAELPETDFVFRAGESGYSCFRIPAIVQTTAGTLLAFAEGRKDICRDNGNVDLVLKRSFDGGKTWAPLQLIWNDEDNTCSYPVPIVDRNSGRIILFSSWSLGEDHWSTIFKGEGKDTRRIFLFHSEDDGASWTPPKEITTSVKLPEWDYYGIGTGSGTQIKRGPFKDRMVAAAYHSRFDEKTIFRSHLIYSDDGGLNWQIGGSSPETGSSECEVAELSDGRLLLNMTKRAKSIRKRSIAYSNDGGLSLTNQQYDEELHGYYCQASLDSYIDAQGQTIVLFSNPYHLFAREDMTVRYSRDDGQSWQVAAHLYEGYVANSDLIIMNDLSLACFFECGKVWPYDGLSFKRFELPK